MKSTKNTKSNRFAVASYNEKIWKNSLDFTKMQTLHLPGSLPKRKLIFQPQCFRCYVSFREGTAQSSDVNCAKQLGKR